MTAVFRKIRRQLSAVSEHCSPIKRMREKENERKRRRGAERKRIILKKEVSVVDIRRRCKFDVIFNVSEKYYMYD